MKPARHFAVVLVTAPDLKTGRKLARLSLAARLAACVNIVPKIESHYWWRGKIEKGAEALLVFKTTRKNLPALEKCILKNHPYDTPEFIALTLEHGTERYLKWLGAATRDE